MIRNLTFILILLSFAAPSFAESNYDEAANPVDVSSSQGASYDNATASNIQYDNNDINSAPQAQENYDEPLANMDAFRDVKDIQPGEYSKCEDMRQSCGAGIEACEKQTFTCNSLAARQASY